MIPKIIHFCWLSNEPYPDKIKKCIDSWHKFLPDYEFVHWNFDRFPRGKSKWVDQAFDSRKYAFAADYIRLYALYKYGGIYLDTDVEVLKSFDDLLHLPYFIGRENTPSGIEAAVLGCEKGDVMIGDMLKSYYGRDYNDKTINSNEPLPFIFRRCIESRYKYNEIENIDQFDYSNDVINVLPIDYFSPKHWETHEINITKNTYSIHHFAGSWLTALTDNEKKLMCWDKLKNIKNTLWGKIISLIKKLLYTTNWFPVLFFVFYKKETCNIKQNIFIYKSEYDDFVKLKKPIAIDNIEFIHPNQSKYADKIIGFYSIAKIKGTEVELHTKPHLYELCSREELLCKLASVWF